MAGCYGLGWSRDLQPQRTPCQGHAHRARARQHVAAAHHPHQHHASKSDHNHADEAHDETDNHDKEGDNHDEAEVEAASSTFVTVAMGRLAKNQKK